MYRNLPELTKIWVDIWSYTWGWTCWCLFSPVFTSQYQTTQHTTNRCRQTRPDSTRFYSYGPDTTPHHTRLDLTLLIQTTPDMDLQTRLRQCKADSPERRRRRMEKTWIQTRVEIKDDQRLCFSDRIAISAKAHCQLCQKLPRLVWEYLGSWIQFLSEKKHNLC